MENINDLFDALHEPTCLAYLCPSDMLDRRLDVIDKIFSESTCFRNSVVSISTERVTLMMTSCVNIQYEVNIEGINENDFKKIRSNINERYCTLGDVLGMRAEGFSLYRNSVCLMKVKSIGGRIEVHLPQVEGENGYHLKVLGTFYSFLADAVHIVTGKTYGFYKNGQYTPPVFNEITIYTQELEVGYWSIDDNTFKVKVGGYEFAAYGHFSSYVGHFQITANIRDILDGNLHGIEVVVDEIKLCSLSEGPSEGMSSLYQISCAFKKSCSLDMGDAYSYLYEKSRLHIDKRK